MDDNWDPPPGPPPIPGSSPPSPPSLPPTAPTPGAEARVELRPGRARGKLEPGGTSVSGGLPIPLIAGAAGLVLLIIIIFAVRGGGDDKAAAVDSSDAGAEQVEPTTPDDDRPEPPPGPSTELRDAVYELSQALSAQKVISEVKIAPAQPSIVLISSVYCSDEILENVLRAHSKRLHNLGVTLVRCFARDGAVVFEKQL